MLSDLIILKECAQALATAMVKESVLTELGEVRWCKVVQMYCRLSRSEVMCGAWKGGEILKVVRLLNVR